jgi:hypothetical protein
VILPGLIRLNSFSFLVQRRWLVLVVMGIAACLSGISLAAQDQSAQDSSGRDGSGKSSAITTLHVNTNLVQIPVLVLTPALEKVSSAIAPHRFSISFNGEPAFRPTYARLEGDDPINLAIVIDTRAPQESLLPKLDEDIANLAPIYLRDRDHVSIYTIDCAKMSVVANVRPDRVQLKRAVDVALNSWTERRHLRKKPPCSANAQLWDGLAYVTNKLARQPGWRAIIAVTDGNDRKSKTSSEELTKLAQNAQVTILGLDPFREGPRGMLSTTPGVVRLSRLCELSGGLRLGLYQSSADQRMRQFAQMLRERYILEFPRPPDLKAGNVLMYIRIDDFNAFIRPAGDGVPVVDEACTGAGQPACD